MIGAALVIAASVGAPGEAASATTDHGAIELVQVTASRRAEAVSRAIPAVTVIDTEAILAAAPQIPADVFRGRPGVYVQQTTPGQGIPIVRGLKGSEVLHLVDGMRLNNALFRNAPNQYLGLVEAANLERVEVVRGPASTLHGADAMGGVVQLITRRPEYRDQPGRRWLARATAATADAALGGWLAFEAGDATRVARVQLGAQDIGDRRTAAGTVRPSGYRARSLSASLRARRGDHAEWQLDLQHLRQPSTPRIDELVPGFGQDQAASSEFSFEPNQRDFVHARYASTRASGWFDEFEVDLAYQRIRDDRRSRALDSPERVLEQNSSELYGLTAQFRRDAGARADLVYGLELYHDRVASARQTLAIDTGVSAPVTARFPDGSSIGSGAVYAHLRHRAGPRVTLDGGLRYSWFDIDLARADRPLGAELDLDELTFSGGARLDLGEHWHLTANLGQGFRPPNIFDLGTLGPRPGNRFNVANPGLGPERLLSLDVGLKWANERWEGEWVAFGADYRDKITSVPTGAFTPDGREVIQSQNVAALKLGGMEFGVRYFGAADWEISAALNHLRGTETGADGVRTAADRIPPLNGRLDFTRRLGERWSGSLRADFARQQARLSPRDAADPRIDPDGTAGWATLSLALDWRPAPRWRLRFGLDNVFDRAYREHGSGIDGRGRSLVLTADAQW